MRKGIINRNTKERLVTVIGEKNITATESGEVKLDDLWKIELSNKNDKEQVENLKKQYDTARDDIKKVFLKSFLMFENISWSR